MSVHYSTYLIIGIECVNTFNGLEDRERASRGLSKASSSTSEGCVSVDRCSELVLNRLANRERQSSLFFASLGDVDRLRSADSCNCSQEKTVNVNNKNNNNKSISYSIFPCSFKEQINSIAFLSLDWLLLC